jgi:excisionase family DNA binding protein
VRAATEAVADALTTLVLAVDEHGEDDDRDGRVRLLTPAEAAARLRISRALFYRLVTSGRLRSLKIGGRRLIVEEDLEAYIASQSEGGER